MSSSILVNMYIGTFKPQGTFGIRTLPAAPMLLRAQIVCHSCGCHFVDPRLPSHICSGRAEQHIPHICCDTHAGMVGQVRIAGLQMS